MMNGNDRKILTIVSRVACNDALGYILLTLVSTRRTPKGTPMITVMINVIMVIVKVSVKPLAMVLPHSAIKLLNLFNLLYDNALIFEILDFRIITVIIFNRNQQFAVRLFLEVLNGTGHDVGLNVELLG